MFNSTKKHVVGLHRTGNVMSLHGDQMWLIHNKMFYFEVFDVLIIVSFPALDKSLAWNPAGTVAKRQSGPPSPWRSDHDESNAGAARPGGKTHGERGTGDPLCHGQGRQPSVWSWSSHCPEVSRPGPWIWNHSARSPSGRAQVWGMTTALVGISTTAHGAFKCLAGDKTYTFSPSLWLCNASAWKAVELALAL